MFANLKSLRKIFIMVLFAGEVLWLLWSLQITALQHLRPCRSVCPGRTCRGTGRPRPRARTAQRTGSAHRPSH